MHMHLVCAKSSGCILHVHAPIPAVSCCPLSFSGHASSQLLPIYILSPSWRGSMSFTGSPSFAFSYAHNLFGGLLCHFLPLKLHSKQNMLRTEPLPPPPPLTICQQMFSLSPPQHPPLLAHAQSLICPTTLYTFKKLWTLLQASDTLSRPSLIVSTLGTLWACLICHTRYVTS